MRAALIAYGLFGLVIIPAHSQHHAIEKDRAIPRFIKLENQWVCVDRNPRQVNRRDCLPRQSSPR
jgi:hypothetical protein